MFFYLFIFTCFYLFIYIRLLLIPATQIDQTTKRVKTIPGSFPDENVHK